MKDSNVTQFNFFILNIDKEETKERKQPCRRKLFNENNGKDINDIYLKK